MGKAIDISGQKFSRLLVLEKTNKRNACGQIYWKCICECGKECEISGTALRTGHTKSCGCYNLEKSIERGHQKLNDLTNQVFGKLTVQYRANNHIKPSGDPVTMWHCLCECGRECDISSQSLLDGRTKSCGCIKKSYGEELITKILYQNNKEFQTEYVFKDCVLPSGKYARFDFFVENTYLIEFDGKQHFDQKAGWDEPLEEIILRDQFKNEYCKSHKIPLYRIPYYDIDKIYTIEDVVQDKYLV